MLGPEVARDSPRVVRLIVVVLVEPDRERAHRRAALRLHQGHNRRRVDPARKEGAERNVGDQSASHGVPQARIESGSCTLHGPFERLTDTALGGRAH